MVNFFIWRQFRIKQNYIVPMKKKNISMSQFQKHQVTHSTFKRNKMYLDLNKIQNDQKAIEIKRRKPYLIEGSPKSQLINQKIGNTFRNSVQQLNSKLGQEMRRFKQRVSPSPDRKFQNSLQTGYQTSRTSFQNPQEGQTFSSKQVAISQKNSQNRSFQQIQLKKAYKIKGLLLDKHLSRQYLYRYSVQKKAVFDERNFNNFSITKHDLSKTQDFKKLPPRNINFVYQNITDLNYNTQSTFQKVYFSTKPMKSTFRYNLQNNKEGRKFFVPVNPENVAATALDPEKIRKSFTQASNFKINKVDSFYKITGRELPHQLEQKQLSPNRNFYRDSEGKIIKPKVDFSVKKMYDDLLRKQKNDHQRKKNPEFTRNQICDQRYFKEMIKRENKLINLEKI